MPTGMCRICSFGSPHLQLFLRGMDAHPQSDFIGISLQPQSGMDGLSPQPQSDMDDLLPQPQSGMNGLSPQPQSGVDGFRHIVSPSHNDRYLNTDSSYLRRADSCHGLCRSHNFYKNPNWLPLTFFLYTSLYVFVRKM